MPPSPSLLFIAALLRLSLPLLVLLLYGRVVLAFGFVLGKTGDGRR